MKIVPPTYDTNTLNTIPFDAVVVSLMVSSAQVPAASNPQIEYVVVSEPRYNTYQILEKPVSLLY